MGQQLHAGEGVRPSRVALKQRYAQQRPAPAMPAQPRSLGMGGNGQCRPQQPTISGPNSHPYSDQPRLRQLEGRPRGHSPGIPESTESRKCSQPCLHGRSKSQSKARIILRCPCRESCGGNDARQACDDTGTTRPERTISPHKEMTAYPKMQDQRFERQTETARATFYGPPYKTMASEIKWLRRPIRHWQAFPVPGTGPRWWHHRPGP